MSQKLDALYRVISDGASQYTVGFIPGSELLADPGDVGATFRGQLLAWKKRIPGHDNPAAWKLRMYGGNRRPSETEAAIIGINRTREQLHCDTAQLFAQVDVPYVVCPTRPAYGLAIAGAETEAGAVARILVGSPDEGLFLNLGANLGFWLALAQFPGLLVVAPGYVSLIAAPEDAHLVERLFNFSRRTRALIGNDFQRAVELERERGHG